MNDSAPTFLRYKEGDDTYTDLTEKIWNAGWSHQCPVYIHRAPPCQAKCPSGHDVRGWLQIVSGLDKPKNGLSWQEYAFQRMTLSNPFPAVMGRCCPAPCEDDCNRNDLDDHVGINSIEQYVGDWALKKGLTFAKPKKGTGKKVAIVGGGPAGISCAYQLRLKGHAPTIFEANEKLGGMMQYGLSSHRCPRDVVDAEIQRILDMGVKVRAKTRVGVDVTVDQLEKEFDAIFWGIGAQKGRTLNVPGGDAPNCIDGLAYLQAANRGQLKYLSGRVLVIGGGDTALDCASVSRRLGNVPNIDPKDRTENVLQGKTKHKKPPADRVPGDVMIVYRRPMERAPAKVEDIKNTIAEGVEWQESLAPVEVVQDKDGRAIALKVVPVDWIDNRDMVPRTGEEYDIECSLIVGAVAQSPDMTGLDAVDNGQGWMDGDGMYRVPGKPQHFVGGDIINPELLTTAIGHGWKAAEGIDKFVSGEEPGERAQIDAHRFDIYEELQRAKLQPKKYNGKPAQGTFETDFAVHNYEDRSYRETQTTKGMFLSYFEIEPRHERVLKDIPEDKILDNYEERLKALTEKDVVAEAKRCMSCGLCLECDNCVVYCPQLAVDRVKKNQRTMGRYVETDYSKCIGCHICADVCPTGYIQMGLGE